MKRSHRQNNFWEPTYQPNTDPITTEFDWKSIKFNNGPNNCVCTSSKMGDIGSFIIEDKSFTVCDFSGDFGFEKTFTFKNCEFNNCHFGRSNWKNIKFHKCRFVDCAFGLTKFRRCQFQFCTFDNISVSSNETVFNNCILSNPEAFAKNIRTNLKNNEEILKEKGFTKSHQLYRLSRSKSIITKNILLSHKEYGDEDLFIRSVKVHSGKYTIYRVKESLHFLREGSRKSKLYHSMFIFPRLLELLTIGILGRLNRWGFGIGRILIFGFLAWLFFGVLYFISTSSIQYSLTKSFDVLTIAGYSKYSLCHASDFDRYTQIINLIVGLSWLSLLFPTILTRITYRFD